MLTLARDRGEQPWQTLGFRNLRHVEQVAVDATLRRAADKLEGMEIALTAARTQNAELTSVDLLQRLVMK